MSGGTFTCLCSSNGGFLYVGDNARVKITEAWIARNVAGKRGGAVSDRAVSQQQYNGRTATMKGFPVFNCRHPNVRLRHFPSDPFPFYNRVLLNVSSSYSACKKLNCFAQKRGFRKVPLGKHSPEGKKKTIFLKKSDKKKLL